MYAVIKTGGKQYKVAPGDVLKVEKLAVPEGEEVEIPHVLMVVQEGAVNVGKPLVESASVLAEVVAQGKGKKVLVMKKKRRKGYKVKRGHRQPYTTLKIKEIKV